jgi:hypothetical protein
MAKYFEAVFNEGKELEIIWRKEKGDFWAYNGVDSTWTGYFSTNPEIKH